MTSTRKSRLRAILDRTGPETEESRLARLRGIVESPDHVCPHCGFKDYTGAPHPFAGIRGQVKAQTKLCTGSASISSKDLPATYEWVCNSCCQHWMYTQDEMECADSDGLCHECVPKENK